ncbi:MAG TPA: 2-oxo acid dehydrogenase subunit E2, partial [Tepidiformaceae bacterium]|nr:2-oxo acid dehydrogenase subunit E2 [Tepidiformaceae bacterium]
DDLDIGIAVATDAGLVVPVVHQADRLSVEGLAVAINEIADKARTRRLRIEDIEGGTFTVNNTGAFGSIASKPIVNAPQVGIVTMERAVRRPVAIDDHTVGIRWMMNVCLSFDHRAMDGTEAGGFLNSLRHLLEEPGR